MKKAVKVGFFDAIISSICYGLYPLFAILLYNTGSSVANSLFYRYAIAFLIYLYILKVHRKIDLAVSLKEFFVLFFVGVTFAISSIALFVALKYIDSGIACTIVFVYPVIVAFIMTLFFHEKLTATTIVSILCAFFGVALLNYAGGMHTGGKFLGFIFSLCGAIMYALYMIFVKKIKVIKYMQTEKVTFYVMLSGTIFYFACLRFGLDFQLLTSPAQWCYVLGLAIIPTIVAIETVNVAIKLIGTTRTAIIGALEPLTAIIVGVLVFSEQLFLLNTLGFLLVITGIFLVVKKN